MENSYKEMLDAEPVIYKKKKLALNLLLEYCKDMEEVKELVDCLSSTTYKTTTPTKKESINFVRAMFKESSRSLKTYEEAAPYVSKALRSSSENERMWVMYNPLTKQWLFTGKGKYPPENYIGELL